MYRPTIMGSDVMAPQNTLLEAERLKATQLNNIVTPQLTATPVNVVPSGATTHPENLTATQSSSAPSSDTGHIHNTINNPANQNIVLESANGATCAKSPTLKLIYAQQSNVPKATSEQTLVSRKLSTQATSITDALAQGIEIANSLAQAKLPTSTSMKAIDTTNAYVHPAKNANTLTLANETKDSPKHGKRTVNEVTKAQSPTENEETFANASNSNGSAVVSKQKYKASISSTFTLEFSTLSHTNEADTTIQAIEAETLTHAKKAHSRPNTNEARSNPVECTQRNTNAAISATNSNTHTIPNLTSAATIPTNAPNSSPLHPHTHTTTHLPEPPHTAPAKCISSSPESQYSPLREETPSEKDHLIEGECDVTSPSVSTWSCPHHSRSPDIEGGWAWVVFVAGFLQFFISSAMYYSFSVYFVELVEAFEEPRAKTGWVYSTNSAVHMFCGPLGGWVISRWGPRVTVMLGGVLACLGCLGTAFAPSLNVIFITYGVINGVGTSLNFSGWVVGLGRFWVRRVCFITGVAMAGSGVGVAVLGPGIAFMVGYYGWRGAMVLSAGLSLHFSLLGAIIFTRTTPPRPCRCPPPEVPSARTGNDPATQSLPSLVSRGSVWSLSQGQGKTVVGPESARVVARWRGWWLVQAGCFLSFMATTTIFAVLLDWMKWAGLGAAFSAGLAGSGAGDVAGRVTAGVIAGRGRPLLVLGGVQLLLATMIGAAAMATSPMQLVIGLVGVGAACGLQSVLHALLPSQLCSGAGVGHLLGWQLVVAGLGALAGPPTAGVLVDLTNSYIPALIMCTAAPAVAAILTLAAHCLTPPPL